MKTDPLQHGVCPDLNRLGAIYALEQVAGFGPVKFRVLHDSGIDARDAIENPTSLPFAGRTGEKLRRGIDALSDTDLATARSQAADQLGKATKLSASILVHGCSDYPERVYASNNPVPVLYVRGDPAVWRGNGTIAVVGSRVTRQPYAENARRLASVAARKGMVIVSGFAVGADTIGHLAAVNADGRTICVMPCGLDKVFPPENHELWKQLLSYPRAAFVSEFRFGLRASSLSLRKRNKLIVAFSQGVLVVQSAIDGGAMNAYRFGREQRKPLATITSDDSEDTSGNKMIAEDTKVAARAFDSNCSESSFDAWLERFSA